MSKDLRKAPPGVTERLSYLSVMIETAEAEDAPSRRVASLGAAVLWLIAADDLLRQLNPYVSPDPSSTTRYKDVRRSQEGGQIVDGLCLARNEIAHGAAFVITAGLRLPSPFPWNFGCSFAPSEVIEASHQQRGKPIRPQQLDSYSRLIAGRTAVDVLKEAHLWLDGILLPEA